MRSCLTGGGGGGEEPVVPLPPRTGETMVVFFKSLVYTNISTECYLYFSDTDATVFFAIFFRVLNFLVGFPANLCTLGIILGGGGEALAAEIQHLSLALCEALYCLGLPAELFCLLTCQQASWDLSPHLYTLVRLQVGLVWIGRPVFQSCICVERYLAVVHPLIYIRLKQPRYRMMGCVAAWAMFLLILVTRVVIPSQDQVDGLVWVFLTLCVFCYCCSSVLVSLKREPPGERWEETSSGARMKRKAFNIILVHLLCFVVNYLPPFVINFITYDRVTMNIFHFFSSLGNVCGLVHPLLYLHRAGMFSRLLAALKRK